MVPADEPPPVRRPDEQRRVGVGDRLQEIHDRADAITSEAESVAEKLDLRSTEAWPRVLEQLLDAARHLGTECFHDGALGPGNAALDPEPYVERLRTAFGFRSATIDLALDLPGRLTWAEKLARAARLAHFVAREPDRWAVGGAVDDLAAVRANVIEQARESSKVTIKLRTDLDDGFYKWVGRATPTIVLMAGKVTVDGPEALHAIAGKLISRHR